MSPDMRAGALVLVRHDRQHPATWSPCTRHVSDPCLFQHIGRVDRVDPRLGAHCVVVVFVALHVPPFGEMWVDSFRADELVLVET
jgi:hypothetical protein